MFFNRHRLARQLQHFGVRQRIAPSQFGRRILDHRGAVAPHHADGLFAQFAPHHGGEAFFQRGLVHVELIRIDRALHHGLAQPVGRGDEHHVAKTRFGIEREQHAGTGDIRAHHALHARRQRHLGMGKAVMHAIGNGAVVIERRKHLPHIRQQVVVALHMQIGFLLPGKRGVGQILGRGRRAHRNRHPIAQREIGLRSPVSSAAGNAAASTQARISAPACGQRRHIGHIQRRQPVMDARTQIVVVEKIPERLRRGGEAARHLDAHAGQIGDHLAQRRILAADARHVRHRQRLPGERYSQPKPA